MKKKLIILLTVLLTMLVILPGCDLMNKSPQTARTKKTVVDNTTKEGEQSPQQWRDGEEILSSDATKSILLGLVRSIERETNIKATKKSNGEDYTEDVIFFKTGSGKSEIVNYTIDSKGDDGRYYYADEYLWQNNGEYYLRADGEYYLRADGSSNYSSESEVNKIYFMMEEDAYQEQISAFIASELGLGYIETYLRDENSIFFGKKITDGEDIRYEIEVAATETWSYSNQTEEVDISIVAENGKIVSMQFTGGWDESFNLTVEYGIEPLPIPSLDGYQYAEY